MILWFLQAVKIRWHKQCQVHAHYCRHLARLNIVHVVTNATDVGQWVLNFKEAPRLNTLECDLFFTEAPYSYDWWHHDQQLLAAFHCLLLLRQAAALATSGNIPSPATPGGQVILFV